MTRPKRGLTNYLFATSKERARAIETVAAEYPDERIKATVTPITKGTARGDAARAIRITDAEADSISDEQRDAVIARFEDLGAAGTHSMVELDVPGGGRRFGFKKFYAQVEEQLPPREP
ncbi:MAG TPA: hypothetical protein VFX86_01365 [Candidatus Saccharimonadales bacterium]|nr:hypothetical protein [Candidatus Saccharimonadales bacterium]